MSISCFLIQGNVITYIYIYIQSVRSRYFLEYHEYASRGNYSKLEFNYLSYQINFELKVD